MTERQDHNVVHHTIQLRISSVILESEAEEALERALPHIRSYFLTNVVLANVNVEDRQEMLLDSSLYDHCSIYWPDERMAEEIRVYFHTHDLVMAQLEFIINQRYCQMTMAPVKEADVCTTFNQYDFKSMKDRIQLQYDKIDSFQL